MYTFFSVGDTIRGLMGNAQVGTETSLLQVLDDAQTNGARFNGSVMRRGLKSMINTDFRLEAWETMVTRSFDTVMQRLVTDDAASGGDPAAKSDASSATDFYIILCGQVFQKILRNAMAKFKAKDCRVVLHRAVYPYDIAYHNMI